MIALTPIRFAGLDRLLRVVKRYDMETWAHARSRRSVSSQTRRIAFSYNIPVPDNAPASDTWSKIADAIELKHYYLS